MPRPKKNARILNIKLSAPIYDLLDKYCAKSGMNKTETVESALTLYLTNDETAKTSFDVYLAQQLRNPEFAKEYKKLQPEYDQACRAMERAEKEHTD